MRHLERRLTSAAVGDLEDRLVVYLSACITSVTLTDFLVVFFGPWYFTCVFSVVSASDDAAGTFSVLSLILLVDGELFSDEQLFKRGVVIVILSCRVT